jgi:hypothetical protein
MPLVTRSLTWLHLSDLHHRLRDDWDSREITETLVRDLTLLQKDYDLRPDLVFFTGDAAFGATTGEKMAHQYQGVRAFLDAIRHAFDPDIPVRDVYFVPGNHDVDRGEITPGETDWLRSPSRALPEILAAMCDGTKQWRAWTERLANYRNFLTMCGLLHLTPDDPHLIWADAREIAGVRVGIAGLNSAWSCVDDSDKGKLWCDADWQIAQLKQRIGPVAFSFALIHHPGNWFTDREDPMVMRRLRQEFPIVLHGHEHQDWIDVDGEARLVISSAACYQCSWMANGYNVGRIDLDARTGQVWMRHWDSTGRGWVPRDIASKTRHGIWSLNHLPWLDEPRERSKETAPKHIAIGGSAQAGAEVTAGEHYTRRFCQHVIDQYDVLELFGCDIPRELQRHQLSVAYVSLNLSDDTNEDKQRIDIEKLLIGEPQAESVPGDETELKTDADLPCSALAFSSMGPRASRFPNGGRSRMLAQRPGASAFFGSSVAPRPRRPSRQSRGFQAILLKSLENGCWPALSSVTARCLGHL